MNLFVIESLFKEDIRYEFVEVKTMVCDKFRIRKSFVRNIVAKAFEPFSLNDCEVHFVKIRPVEKPENEKYALLIMPKEYFKELKLEPKLQELKELVEKKIRR